MPQIIPPIIPNKTRTIITIKNLVLHFNQGFSIKLMLVSKTNPLVESICLTISAQFRSKLLNPFKSPS